MNDPLLTDLRSAVVLRRQVEFAYDRQPRLVQPVALGTDRITGDLVLHGYQVGGRSNSRPPPFWTLFAVDRIVDLVVTDRPYEVELPDHCRILATHATERIR